LWEEYIGPRYFVKTDLEKKVKILGLDSNEPDRNEGRMGEKAIERIYEEFSELDDEWLKILVFHHQSLPIKFTGRERSALVDAGDTIKAIMDCNIDLVLNGHRHISNVYKLTDGDINTLVVNCGTMSCKKTRYHEEYSITLIEINDEQTKAKVDVQLLNEDNESIINKYDGTLKTVKAPSKLGELKATIVHMGNTDFSHGSFVQENYAKAVQFINSLHKCDIVIHCGDVTASSYPEEFVMAQSLLSQIQKPLIVVPGPRDYFPLGYELFPKYIGSPNVDYSNDNVKVLGFNSCILDEKIGRLGRSRSKLLLDELKGIDQIGLIAFHHTIIPLPKTKHESELEDAGDLLALLVENNINLVLTGAKNRSGSWQINDTVFVNTGTVSSKNITTAKGNSINIINIYNTEKGYFYKVEEYFLESDNMVTIGQYHVKIKK
ncbi:MAG: metallophosphoesterase, partial [Candidatus Heimdallarchaeota archaeon]|nr:metallophosphoesterase [Candidatus Heimdallarchaeota archaeon]